MKALVWKESHGGREIGQIERISSDQEIDSWKHWLKSKMEIVEVPSELESESVSDLESYIIPAVESVEYQQAHWTNGQIKVYSASEIPVITNEDGSAYLDPSYKYIKEVKAVEAKPQMFGIRKKA